MEERSLLSRKLIRAAFAIPILYEQCVSRRVRYLFAFSRQLAKDLASYDPSKYAMSIVPTNPDGELRFHLGEPITVTWRAPHGHSRRDWIGLYRVRSRSDLSLYSRETPGLTHSL